ncbi:MAG TPA: MerR family transcriptional regulator [Anaerolineales bacterium]|jgi:DNA-binding transcriptional MerR regulator
MFTVKQLSGLAGVTPRTLHHYDAIGLLKPTQVGANGYRYYGDESLLILQQILFYRELGLPLEDIKQIMGRHGFDVLTALEGHRVELGRRIERLERLLGTVENTILYMKGKKEMSSQQIFFGFSEEEQEKYAAEVEKLYDPETVRASNRRWKSYSAEKKQSILDEAGQIYVEISAAMPNGPQSEDAQALVERWRANMDYFWTPKLEQLQGLAEMYEEDPRFKANFDAMHPGLAGFMKEAVRYYVARKSQHS